MKKLFLTFVFLTFVFAGYSQNGPWNGFFKPVNRFIYLPVKTIDRDVKVDETTSFWLFRPIVQISAMQFLIEKPVKVTTLSSIGTGISYSHFINSNGQPY